MILLSYLVGLNTSTVANHSGFRTRTKPSTVAQSSYSKIVEEPGRELIKPVARKSFGRNLKVNKIQQEIIKTFQSFCAGLETFNPNDYEEVWSISEVDSQTGKKIRTAVLRKREQ